VDGLVLSTTLGQYPRAQSQFCILLVAYSLYQIHASWISSMAPSDEQQQEKSGMVSSFVNRLPFSVKASVAEFLATAIFVYIGTGM